MGNRYFLMNKDKKILCFESHEMRFGGAFFDIIKEYNEPLPLSFSTTKDDGLTA